MKHILFLILPAILASCKGENRQSDIDRMDTVPVLLQQVKQCSKLYTEEYKVHKIVTHDDQMKVSGKALGKDYSFNLPGKRKVAIPINVTLKAYIDMSAVTENDIHHKGEKIEIVLPIPHVTLTSSSIDHDGLKQYVALWRRDFSDEELANYEQQGRQAIINDIPKMDILERARESAARLLIPMIEKMGFKEENISITFVNTNNKERGLSWILD